MEQQILKRRRKELGYTLDYIAKKIGVTEATVQRWESGNIKNLRQGRLIQLAEILEISPTTLMGWEDYTKKSEALEKEGYTVFPVCEPDITDFENSGYTADGNNTVNIPDNYLTGHKKEDFFVLRIADDSMFPQYQSGDKILILKQDSLAYSGQTGAVLYGNSKIILRRIDFNGENQITLVPINPNIAPQKLEGEKTGLCRIIGVPKLLIREL